jgi:nifR3 family TIM-barrel protein
MKYNLNTDKPIIATAPMEDVTDTIFRAVLLNDAKPDTVNMVFTEFVPTDGLCHEVGQEKVSHRMVISPQEKDLLDKHEIVTVVQIWGANPDKFRESVKHIEEHYNFDAFDINMGCPMKKIMKQSGGAALIETPDLAKEIVYSVKESTAKPVSVKTRTGLNQHSTEDWIAHILETKPDMLTLHGRTRKMMYKGLADWDEIQKAAEMTKAALPDSLFLGNGDILSVEQGYDYSEKYKVDGVMIGRGLMSNPYMFAETPLSEKSIEERTALLMKHAEMFCGFWGEEKSFNILKKFFKAYISDFQKASEIRHQLMQAKSFETLSEIIKTAVPSQTV